MSLHRMKAFEIEYGLDEAVGRRIAVEGGYDVCPEGMRDGGIAHECFGKGFADYLPRHFRPMQPLAHALDDSRLKRVVAQDGGVDEARKIGLAPHDLVGFVSDAGPDRIDVVEPACGLRLDLSHVLSENARNAARDCSTGQVGNDHIGVIVRSSNGLHYAGSGSGTLRQEL